MSLSATFTPLLNTSRDGDSTNSMDSLLQCLTTLLVIKVKGLGMVSSEVPAQAGVFLLVFELVGLFATG